MKRSTFLRAIAASATTAALGRDMALDAARHWRAGTPGTDPEDAPSVARLVPLNFAMNLRTNEIEALSFEQMLR